jgi:hypothetical protein
MGGACSTTGEKRNACRLLVRKPKEDQNICGWIILRLVLERGLGGVDWIGLAQDRDKWRNLVNAVMNVWVP